MACMYPALDNNIDSFMYCCFGLVLTVVMFSIVGDWQA